MEVQWQTKPWGPVLEMCPVKSGHKDAMLNCEGWYRERIHALWRIIWNVSGVKKAFLTQISPVYIFFNTSACRWFPLKHLSTNIARIVTKDMTCIQLKIHLFLHSIFIFYLFHNIQDACPKFKSFPISN